MRTTITEKVSVLLILSCLMPLATAAEGLALGDAINDTRSYPHYAELVQPVAPELQLRREAFERESSLDHTAIGRSRLMVPHESLLAAMKEAPAYEVAERTQSNGQVFVFTPFDGEQSYFLENLYTFDHGRVAEWRGDVRDVTGAAVGEATLRFYSDGRYRWHISAGRRHLVVRSTSDPSAAILIEISNEFMRNRKYDAIPDEKELERAYQEMLRQQE